jgi:putative transposase
VKNNPIKVYGFVVMPNHIHLIWKINQQHKRESVQRDFLTYTAQQIKFDLSLHHPKVLAHFEVNLKDRKYQFWERNPLSIDLFSRTVIEQKLDYIHERSFTRKMVISSKT